MTRRFISVTLAFLLMLAIVFGVSLIETDQSGAFAEARGSQLVRCNDIAHLIAQGDSDQALAALNGLQEEIRLADAQERNTVWMLAAFGLCFAFLLAVFFYIYFFILRPFDKMQEFAELVAAGHLDIPLRTTRGNYFGAFTWAFDSMRREIVRARAGERESVENNKTVIATLSHDIKTPIASLRVYAEGLEANMDNTPEKRQKYISVILRKCDEVAQLTDDLFIHALSDLERLNIDPIKIPICAFLKRSIAEITAEADDIRFEAPDFEAVVSADEKRVLQITENIINNARKYAKTPVEISVCRNADMVEIHFQDHGPGIPDEDIPFIFGKFYRGKNAGTERGSGLGLYIVKYLTEKMGGSVLLKYNHGLEVIISFPICLS